MRRHDKHGAGTGHRFAEGAPRARVAVDLERVHRIAVPEERRRHRRSHATNLTRPRLELGGFALTLGAEPAYAADGAGRRTQRPAAVRRAEPATDSTGRPPRGRGN